MIVSVPPGAVKATLTEVVFITVTVPIVGALDIVVTEDDTVDAVDVPPELVAVIVNV